MQSELNKVWRAEAEPLPGQPAPPALEDAMPSRMPAEPEAPPPEAPAPEAPPPPPSPEGRPPPER
jgi:hypothetical protein